MNEPFECTVVINRVEFTVTGTRTESGVAIDKIGYEGLFWPIYALRALPGVMSGIMENQIEAETMKTLLSKSKVYHHLT